MSMTQSESNRLEVESASSGSTQRGSFFKGLLKTYSLMDLHGLQQLRNLFKQEVENLDYYTGL